MSLAGSALHCLVIGSAVAREVGRERDDFLHMSVVIVPKLDLERQNRGRPHPFPSRERNKRSVGAKPYAP